MKSLIVAAIDALLEIPRQRMREASSTMVGLRPSECDWMTSEELGQLHQLKLQLPSHGEEAAAARERLKLKRNEKRSVSRRVHRKRLRSSESQ